MYLAASWSSRVNEVITGGYIERGEYGADPVVYDLMVKGMDDKTVECQLEVRSQRYDVKEAEETFDRISAVLPELVRGENLSLDEVRFDLNLPEVFEEYGVRARWFSSEPEVLDSYGRIMIKDCPNSGIPVLLTVELTADDYKREEILPIHVLPRLLSEEEVIQRDIEELLLAAETQFPEQKEVFLPTEYQGKTLTFDYKQDNDHAVFPLLGLLAAALLYAKEKQDAQNAEKLRRQRLLLGYADMVYQLMVYTGAGLAVTRAWEQIVKNYEQRLAAGRCEKHPAYEEMAVAYSQMQCGMAEGKAIDDFGRRCNLQQYLKLSTLLNQNRRTGTRNLQELLEQEMAEAWEQQKNTARRLGEEAGTKLLAPLFLMLIIVMVIIMVPAMMSM